MHGPSSHKLHRFYVYIRYCVFGELFPHHRSQYLIITSMWYSCRETLQDSLRTVKIWLQVTGGRLSDGLRINVILISNITINAMVPRNVTWFQMSNDIIPRSVMSIRYSY